MGAANDDPTDTPAGLQSGERGGASGERELGVELDPGALGVSSLERDLVREAARARLFGVAPQPVKVGRFEIMDRIGEGGMGVVYKARDPDLERWVAVKVIAGQGDSNPRQRERLLREAKAMARLSHPNVVVVHEVGEHQGQVFIAMEFVDGDNLRGWLGQKQRSLRDVVRTMIAVGRGIEAAHRRGLIHRDIKPENVLIESEGRARVADFGLVRAEDTDSTGDAIAEAPTAGYIESSMTRTGALMGTPAYMAPEQIHGRGADARSDQFGFCATLFEALYGVRPFVGNNVSELLWAMTTGKMSPRPDDAEVPDALHAVLLRGLRVDPDDRFPSMGELLDELKHALGADVEADDSATHESDADGATARALAAAATDPSGELAAPAAAAPAEATAAPPPGSARWRTVAWIGALVAVAAVALFAGRLLSPAQPAAVATADETETADTSTETVEATSAEEEPVAEQSSDEDGSESPTEGPPAGRGKVPASPSAAGPTPPPAGGSESPAPASGKRCRGERACTKYGMCTPRGTRCVATSDADCQQSTNCRALGQCGVSHSMGECVATKPEHCRAASICGSQGDCTLKDGYCHPGSDADCEQSALCRDQGRCKDHGSCGADSEARCRASTMCRTHGLCSLGYTNRCEAKTDADCQGSSRCQSAGECKARNGRCVKDS